MNIIILYIYTDTYSMVTIVVWYIESFLLKIAFID